MKEYVQRNILHNCIPRDSTSPRVQDQQNCVRTSKFYSFYLELYKNKFKNLIRTSKFKFLFQGLQLTDLFSDTGFLFYFEFGLDRVHCICFFFLSDTESNESRQYQQLQALYKARGRKLEEITNDFDVFKEEKEREHRILKHQLSIAQGNLNFYLF